MFWRVVYEDGSTFCSRDGSFQEAPAFGVLAVVCDQDEPVLGGDLTGLIDFLVRTGLVKFGRMTDNQTYRKVTDPVLNQPDPELGFERVVNVGNDYYWWMGDLR